VIAICPSAFSYQSRPFFGATYRRGFLSRDLALLANSARVFAAGESLVIAMSPSDPLKHFPFF
jgi:hypothetical protein